MKLKDDQIRKGLGQERRGEETMSVRGNKRKRIRKLSK